MRSHYAPAIPTIAPVPHRPHPFAALAPSLAESRGAACLKKFGTVSSRLCSFSISLLPPRPQASTDLPSAPHPSYQRRVPPSVAGSGFVAQAPAAQSSLLPFASIAIRRARLRYMRWVSCYSCSMYHCACLLDKLAPFSCAVWAGGTDHRALPPSS